MQAKNQGCHPNTSKHIAGMDQIFLVKSFGIEIVEIHFVKTFDVQKLMMLWCPFDSRWLEGDSQQRLGVIP